MNQRRVRVLPRSESRRGEYAAKPHQQGICAILFLKLPLRFSDTLFLWIELIHRGVQKDV